MTTATIGPSDVGYGNWTVELATAEQTYQLCRIWFERDGTYSVTMPFHQVNAATVGRVLKLQSHANVSPIISESLNRVTLTDDESRLRFSHHPDGTMGFTPLIHEAEETLRIQAEPMAAETKAIPSPTLWFMILDPTELSPTDGGAHESVTFDSRKIAPGIGQGIQMDGAYFPADWREFLIREDDQWLLRLVHGNHGVITLRALLSSPDCETQGFLGIRVTRLSKPSRITTGFQFVGAGNTTQRDEVNVRDELHCVYPEPPMFKLPLTGQEQGT